MRSKDYVACFVQLNSAVILFPPSINLMIYQQFKPNHLLAPFVHCYYFWEHKGKSKRLLKVESPPSGYCSIVINYGGSCYFSNAKYEQETAPHVFFSGQFIKRYQLSLQGNIAQIGAVFKPTALSAIFGISMAELVDERVPLDALCSAQDVSELLDKVAVAMRSEQKIWILENFLLRYINKKSCSVNRIDNAANLISKNKGVLSMDELWAASFLSRRQFERRFLRKVGLSPKYYSKLTRISTLCNHMARSEKVDWNTILSLGNYYDQAHFIREFKHFIGVPPGKYYKKHSELINFLD